MTKCSPHTALELRRLVADCRSCGLWRDAGQAVCGEGPTPAPMVMVGEQPGDQEDHRGRPFVGPAGRLLGGALEEAGIERDRIYLTNAVKHFKWKPRGKRRIHDRPNRSGVLACRPWLESELDLAQPEVLVLHGRASCRSARRSA